MNPADKRIVRRIIFEHFDYIVSEWNKFEEKTDMNTAQALGGVRLEFVDISIPVVASSLAISNLKKLKPDPS
ncbi:MAG TPA: hypothetical protein VLU47_01775 [Blastocatellia bacterium]|nr:hypothetical protein [Blastocatellia bacterium]